MASVQELNQRIQRESAFVQPLVTEIRRVIVGQDYLINRLLVALLSDGHVLIEGVPGLAKTLSVRTLAATINASFQRIQFTPDLLPSDLIGTLIYEPKTGVFVPHKGPIFANIILADEINRAPAKVQSALLEAMEERQITLGDETHTLDNPFLVLATQNPIEQEGTYPLPEAQLDRFMLKVVLDYPTREQEREIMKRMGGQRPEAPQPIIDAGVIFRARAAVNAVMVDPRIEDYILNIVFATRNPAENGLNKLESYIEVGASPRATLALLKASKAYAFLRGKGYVSPEDVKQMVIDVLRHRILPSFEAEAEGITSDQIIRQVVSRIAVP